MAQPVHSATTHSNASLLPSQPPVRPSLPTQRPDSIESSPSQTASEEGCLASIERFLRGLYAGITDSLHCVVAAFRSLFAKGAAQSVVSGSDSTATSHAQRHELSIQEIETRAFEAGENKRRELLEKSRKEEKEEEESRALTKAFVKAEDDKCVVIRSCGDQSELYNTQFDQIIAQLRTPLAAYRSTSSSDMDAARQELERAKTMAASVQGTMESANAEEAVAQAQTAYDRVEAHRSHYRQIVANMQASKAESRQALTEIQDAISALKEAKIARIAASQPPFLGRESQQALARRPQRIAAAEAAVATAQATCDTAAEKWNRLYRRVIPA